MGLLDAFKDKQFRDDVADNGMNFLRSASNAAATNVTGPVDMLAWALRKAGLPIPDAPTGGSNWAKNVGLLNDVKHNPSAIAGETMGLLAPVAMTAGAPKVAKGLLQMADNAAAPRMMNPETGAIVWHGSPHKFDKFDSSKIGTGEGAQAYGHGLYLAENPAVAREYQEKLSSTGGAKNLASQYGDVDKGITEAQRRIAHYKQLIADGGGGDLRRANGMLNIAQKSLDDLTAMKAGLPESTGALYKVDLPDEHIAKMLDWDKPLSQQSPEVLQSFNNSKLGKKVSIVFRANGIENRLPYTTFGDALKMLKDGTGVDTASQLREAGILGIRYLDGGSRGIGAGTSNFVVFPGNENLLQILERNGQALK